MTVMIGVDPHKASHTAVAIPSDGEDRARPQEGPFRVARKLAQLVSWGGRTVLDPGTWAIQLASGLCYLLAQQLVAAGETVVDVPAMLSSRARLLSTGRSNKNDPNDALLVAVAALRLAGPAYVWKRSGTVKCCACSRNGTIDIGNQRSRARVEPHALGCAGAGWGWNRQGNQRF